MPRIPIIVWPIAVLGVVFAVGLNAFTDGKDHNLFPIEMVIWAGVATPGSLAGALLGSTVYWLKKKWHNHTSEGIRQPADGSPKPSM